MPSGVDSASGQSPVLECRDLRGSYGNRVAVDGVSFRIDGGECFGLLGPNGAGKTTIVSLVCGLLESHGGEVSVCGEAMRVSGSAPRAAIGYVPQEIAVYPDLSGRENVRFFGTLRGMHGRALDDAVDEALGIVGLRARADDLAFHYSGGMQRRLNVAIGLLGRPPLLVLDEPTVGVDPQSRNSILETVAKLTRDGVAVLYTSHYMDEVARLCQRIGILDDGRLVAVGARDELMRMAETRQRVVLRSEGSPGPLADECRRVESDVVLSNGCVEVLVDDATASVPRLLSTAAAAGIHLAGLEVREPELETVFLALTGRALRD